jgi:hypothetical protein
LDEQLAGLDFFPGYRLAMHGEMGGQTGEIGLILRHRNRLTEDLGAFGNGNNLNIPSPLTTYLMPAGWLYQNQYRCTRVVTDYYLPAADAEKGTYSPELVNQGDAALTADTKTPSTYNWYEQLMLPGLGHAVMKFAYGQTSVHLARIAIALERYRMAHGEYPEALDALAPQFIAQVPLDVIGGQPLKYRRTGGGQFALYSVGWNGTDDGGVPVISKGADAGLDLSAGDWVWQAAK